MLPLILAALTVPTSTPEGTSTRVAMPLGGAVVPGLCMLSRPAVFANAKVGVAATVRLQQLAQAANTEIDTQRAAVAADARALQAREGKLAPAAFKQNQQDLTDRMRALEQRSAQRSREIEATRQKALGRIAAEMQPVVAQAYEARGCGLLVDRNVVLGGNMANDLTAAVVQGLDAKIVTITFDRETLAPSRQP